MNNLNATLNDSREVYAIEWGGECYQSIFPIAEAYKSSTHTSIEDATNYMVHECHVPQHLIHVYPYFNSKIIPITQESSMTFNPDDANSVSRFFQGLADKVVLASTLPKEVEELRQAVTALKADVESYREHMARADEEISNLRRERAQLQDENATLHNDLKRSEGGHAIAETRWSQACSERDRWHNDFISIYQAHEDIKRERDDAQMRALELEEKLTAAVNDANNWREQTHVLTERLNLARSALA